MKPILYSAAETAFDSNGIGVLTDAIECRVVAELNGQYELTLRYPITGIHYKDIVRRAIILAKPDPVSAPQPFRIYRRVPSSQGTVTAYARHIAYDLMGNVVSPFGATGAANALQALKNNSVTPCPFTFWTNKEAGVTMAVTTPASIWSLLGGSEGSVLDVFGGEYEFDRFAVKLWNRRGADRGVSIRYGKNLTSLEQDENISSTYTGVYPYWQDAEGNLVQLPERVVAVPGTFDHVRIMPLDLSVEWQEPPTEAQLRDRAVKYISDNDIGTPVISWKVQHVDLEQTEEYKEKLLLERVIMGDTVSVEFSGMNISASARITATDFDALLERYNSTTLGNVKANLAGTIAQQGKELQKKPSVDFVKACTNALNASLTPAEVFNRLTNYGAVQGIYIKDDKLFINAEFAQILNFVTEKLKSVSGDSELDIDGANVSLSGKHGETFSVNNFEDGVCYIYMRKYNSEGVAVEHGQIGANGIALGGSSWLKPTFGVFAKEDGSVLMGISPDSSDTKTISWKDNGDGTFTLIGR